MNESAPVLRSAIPILLTADLSASTAFFERLGFRARYNDGSYAIIERDDVELHLALSEGVTSLTNSSECRVNVTGINNLYEQCRIANAVHPNGKLNLQPYGMWEFAVLDPGGICVKFAERIE